MILEPVQETIAQCGPLWLQVGPVGVSAEPPKRVGQCQLVTRAVTEHDAPHGSPPAGREVAPGERLRALCLRDQGGRLIARFRHQLVRELVDRLRRIQRRLVEPAPYRPLRPMGDQHAVRLEVGKCGTFLATGDVERVGRLFEHASHVVGRHHERQVSGADSQQHRPFPIAVPYELHPSHRAAVGVKSILEPDDAWAPRDDPSRHERHQYVRDYRRGIARRRAGQGLCEPSIRVDVC
jgi:hypothetical protein